MRLDASERGLVRLALLSRFAVLALALLAQGTLLPLPGALWRTTAGDAGRSSFPSHYDASAQLLVRRACPAATAFDRSINLALGWQAHWDGLHFLEALPNLRQQSPQQPTQEGTADAAVEGPPASAWWLNPDYEVEKESAFGLGWPVAVGLLAAPLHNVLSLVGVRCCLLSAVLLASGALSLLLLVANTLLLHRLTLSVLVPLVDGSGILVRSSPGAARRLAFMSSVCFVFSPAALFHAAGYSEALFTFLSLLGMLLFQQSRGEGRPASSQWCLIFAAVAFGLCTVVRANGWLLAGFFAFDALQRSKTILRSATQSQRAVCLARLWGTRILLCLLTAAPFIVGQLLLARRFCASPLVQPKPAYCVTNWFPAVYTHVQSTYWNVGLFRYYTLQQLPNFLLALPVWTLSLAGIWEYLCARPREFFSLGLQQSGPAPLPPPPRPRYPLRPRTRRTVVAVSAAAPTSAVDPSGAPLLPSSGGGFSAPAAAASLCEDSWTTPSALPFVYLWTALFLVCVGVLHVQVSTRFLSACPPLYWYAARLLVGLRPPDRLLHTGATEAQGPLSASATGVLPLPSSSASSLLSRWSFAFVLLGGVLFPAFLPWT